MPKKTTVSIIKCDVGSLAGHHIVPKPLFDIAEKNLAKAMKEGFKSAGVSADAFCTKPGKGVSLLEVKK